MAEGTIQSRRDFHDSQQYWTIEIKAAKDNREDFLKQGENAVKRFLDERKGDDSGPKGSRLNLYHANVQTERALLYGKTPSVDVGRRFSDSQDDVARYAAEAVERILNTDIECDDDGFTAALRYSVEDWTCPGLGVLWARYETGEEVEQPGQPAKMGPCPECGGMNPQCPACGGTGQVERAPAVPPTVTRPDEDVECDYIHWRDFLWSPCRNWNEARWVAKRVEMTKDDVVAKFGQEFSNLPLQSRAPNKDDYRLTDEVKDAWSRAEIWEIWCKDDRTVYHFCEGYDRILKKTPDPLGLEEFLPCSRPLLANVTTDKLMPKPNLELAKDLYDEIDTITYRIKKLEECAKVRWAYDAGGEGNEALKRIFTEAYEGLGIPVKNWNALQEKGGLQGAMQFVPIADFAKAIELLSQRRAEKIQLMYQITGMSDIVRGQAAQRATATEQSIKAQFASTRIQTSQDELARFASDFQTIRAEIISKHFSPETIVIRSNLQQHAPPQMIGPAVDLIKSDIWKFRIAVRPESIALPDMATQRQERSDAIQALGSYFSAMMPLVQMSASQPQALGAVMDFVIRTGQWMIAGLRGASEVEEAFDSFAQQAKALAAQPPPPPQPDPQLQVAQVKAQAEMGKAQASQQQTAMDMQASQMEHQQRMREMALEGVQKRIEAQTQMAVNASKPPPQIGGNHAQ